MEVVRSGKGRQQPFLGLLCSLEEFNVFGFALNSGACLTLVTQDTLSRTDMIEPVRQSAWASLPSLPRPPTPHLHPPGDEGAGGRLRREHV